MSFNKFSSEIKPKAENMASDNSKALPEKSAKEPAQTKSETAQATEK